MNKVVDNANDSVDPQNETNLKWVTLSQPLAYLGSLQAECCKTMKKIDQFTEKEWHYFRKLANPYDFVCKSNVGSLAVNRAFYKLWEILAMFPLVDVGPSGRILLLAEAPGSFVQVVKKKWPHAVCRAISKPLDSYANVVKTGSSAPRYSKTVVKAHPDCQFDHLDLLNGGVIKSLVKNQIKYQLVTADGGFDEQCMYNQKETLHFDLILAQVVAILGCQQIGGSCVLKVFETFTVTSFDIIWLLCQHYSTFDIVKPLTSRPTNSEQYIVCQGFQGSSDIESLLGLLDTHVTLDMTLFPLVKQSPARETFVKKMVDAIHRNSCCQIMAIDQVIGHLKKEQAGKTSVTKKQFYENKRTAFGEWKKRFGYVD